MLCRTVRVLGGPCEHAASHLPRAATELEEAARKAGEDQIEKRRHFTFSEQRRSCLPSLDEASETSWSSSLDPCLAPWHLGKYA